jgi:tetratricopeptide (TPR) repeat protein
MIIMKKGLNIMSICISIAMMFSVSISAKGDRHPTSRLETVGSERQIQRDEFEKLITDAYNLYVQKKYDEALAICAKAAQMRPNDNRPYAISGLVYMGQWKMKSASEALAKAITLSPQNPRLYYVKAVADRNRNAKEESIAAARKAIELDPKYAEAFAILGESLAIGSSESGEAIAAFREAIKLKPELFSAYRELGMHLSVAKDEKSAEEIYRKAMELDPKKMACRFDLGRLLVKQGRLSEARALWEARTSDIDNTIPNFISVLERAEKLKWASETLAKQPNDPKALLEMGLMVMEGESWVVDGRQERAIEYFKKALSAKPNYAEAQYAICKAYVELAHWSKEKNKSLEGELDKLRKLDVRLADQIVEYRKNYVGGIKGDSKSIDQ